MMNKTERQQRIERHSPIDLLNGMTVCKCGAGNDPESLPYYGDKAADLDMALRSRDAFADHLSAILSL